MSEVQTTVLDFRRSVETVERSEMERTTFVTSLKRIMTSDQSIDGKIGINPMVGVDLAHAFDGLTLK